MERRIRLWVNGEPREVREGCAVVELLELLKVTAERVAVEINGEVIRKARHAEQRLKEGDKVEVVTFVGGG